MPEVHHHGEQEVEPSNAAFKREKKKKMKSKTTHKENNQAKCSTRDHEINKGNIMFI